MTALKLFLKSLLKKAIRIAGIPFVLADYFRFRKARLAASVDSRDRFSVRFRDFYPCIRDKTMTTGFDRHYVYHTAWAIRKVKEISPTKHVDISSSLYFATHISAFYPTEFYDYRPALISGLDGLVSKKADLMALPFANNSIESISCLHTIEHIGLGRYGDPIDPAGDLKAINELKRVVAKGGSILFVSPVGRPIIEFNAHRIYSYAQVLNMFSGLRLKEFSLIPEHEKDGGLIQDALPEIVNRERYACGCFWFVKD